ncbi:MAG: hypothetical protein GY820_38360 [Gammaproteobacteria bacterium]|nr:hypothetical protein [Gammaproteobacteria bacterium]
MEIKLCYKTYPFKMSLAACKAFYDATGDDLQYTLLKYIEACRDTVELDLLARMSAFMNVCKFEVAAHALHALIRTEDKSIPLNEVRDGMFRVSWLPSERTDDLSEPWPLVMLDIANQVNEYFEKNVNVKKKGTKLPLTLN